MASALVESLADVPRQAIHTKIIDSNSERDPEQGADVSAVSTRDIAEASRQDCASMDRHRTINASPLRPGSDSVVSSGSTNSQRHQMDTSATETSENETDKGLDDSGLEDQGYDESRVVEAATNLPPSKSMVTVKVKLEDGGVNEHHSSSETMQTVQTTPTAHTTESTQTAISQGTIATDSNPIQDEAGFDRVRSTTSRAISVNTTDTTNSPRNLLNQAPTPDIEIKSEEEFAQQAPKVNIHHSRDNLEDVLIGTRVAEGHENFVTAYNMLTGIRFAVSKTTAKLNRAVIDSDFNASTEEYFDPNDNGSKHYFQFKDYAPWVFRHLRELFGLDPADYLMSMTAKYIVSELGSPGKSGSFFYYSRDYRFIIKTIRHEEHKRLRQILKDYYMHVKRYPDTLLSQFYGLHRVRLPLGRKIHFVVMNNVFPALYEIHKRYDLKGSLLGRELKPYQGPARPYIVYKDLDFLRAHERIIVGSEKRKRLINQLENDVKFLQRVNVMDYSLLVGIHDVKKGNAGSEALVGLREFGPRSDNNSTASGQSNSNKQNGSSEILSKKAQGASHGSHSTSATLNPGNKLTLPPSGQGATSTATQRQEFAKLQKQLSKANPRALREFDFVDDFRSNSYFYKDHGGFQSTNEDNEDREVIYYLGVIDFLTGYSFRKHVETFCKGLVHKRSELSAVPAQEYGERFLRFMHGAIGPEIKPEANKKTAARADDRSGGIPTSRTQTINTVRTAPEMLGPTSMREVHKVNTSQTTPARMDTASSVAHQQGN